MRVIILLAAILTSSASAMAGGISITSPDHAQTFAYGEMVSHQFYLNQVAGELIVQITFSNQPYADSNDPPSEESFSFRFPGVQFDSARRIFFARSRHDEWIPVAQSGKGLACGWVDLAPGAKIYLEKDSGRVTATLTATNHPRAGTRWVQADDNFSLQNILTGLFGKFFPDPEN
jgi:hypothetical protein